MSLTHYSGMHSNSPTLSPRAYTLVELIVVIAILVVLSTVGFVGYSQYTASSRDGARVSDLRAIYQGIGVSISQKGIAPAPDSPVSIYASTGVLLSLQGSVGESVRQAIGLESGGRDPQDGVGYTYLRFKDKKSVQLMALFEAEEMGAKIAFGESGVWGESVYAASDYTDRYPAAFGKKLWVLVQRTTNTPLQEVSSYTASGVNLGLTSISSGSGILVIGNTGSGVSENLSGTGVLARVLSPASLVITGGSIPSGPKGTSATDSAISCKALKTNGVSTDGLYWIKPTADPAFQAYCDMVTDGGGWTKMMHANMPNFFTATNWENTGSPTALWLYSILGKRIWFFQGGVYELRLQIGRTGDSNTPSSKSKYTIWKQPHDGFTQATNGAGYQFIAGDQSTTCGGFNGLHVANWANGWRSITYDTDTTESANCWWMQIVPTLQYQGSNYLDGYAWGGTYHVWQSIWMR